MAVDRSPFTVGFGVDSDQAELPQWVTFGPSATPQEGLLLEVKRKESGAKPTWALGSPLTARERKRSDWSLNSRS